MVKNVVVVEDQPVVRMIAVDVLKDAGWSVVEFASADEAIEFCAHPANDIAALFTDINMPGQLDGLDLAALVVRSRPNAAVVVSSGRFDDAPADLVDRARFLAKRWSAESLLAAISDAEPSDG